MTREQQAISANFDLLLTSIRKSSVHTEGAATAVCLSQQDRSNAGSEFKMAAALHSHEQARENFLMSMSGCDE